MSNKDKVFITGASGGIGSAIAKKFNENGYNLILISSSSDKLIELKKKYGDNHDYYHLDLSDLERTTLKMNEIVSNHPDISIIVNNAGLREEAQTAEMTTEEWKRVLSVNLDGPFYCSRAAIPGMMDEGWGRIINVSGLNAFKGKEGWGHVSASKMGALGLTRALSAELASENILVNHIVPGPFDTSGNPIPMVSDNIPVGRLGMPEEIASTVDFLVSPENGFITGQTLHVNGGILTY